MTYDDFKAKHKANVLKGFDDLDGRDYWAEFKADLHALLADERKALELQVEELQKDKAGRIEALKTLARAIEDRDDKIKESNRLINAFPEIVEALAMEAFLAARKIRLPGATDAFASDVKAAVEAKAKELLTPEERPFTTETLKALQDSPHKAPEEPYTEKRSVSSPTCDPVTGHTWRGIQMTPEGYDRECIKCLELRTSD